VVQLLKKKSAQKISFSGIKALNEDLNSNSTVGAFIEMINE
jgi:hypothetical protein